MTPKLAEIISIEPSSLVIPGGYTGGFKLQFMSLKSQLIEGMISYTINDQHEFNFKVTARVEQAVLKLSASFLKFVFDDDDLEQFIKHRVVIENHCSADTRFEWVISPKSNFEVIPMSDVVPANQSMYAIVKFTPEYLENKGEEEILTMRVQNGEACGLRCLGQFSEAKCSFIQKAIDFGIIPVGIKQEQQVTLQNKLKTPAVFYVKNDNEELSVQPTRARVAGFGRVNLKVEFNSGIEQEYKKNLEISVRGGKTISLEVNANVIVPRVRILEPEIDFGGITCKSTAFHELTIVNDSPIPAALVINLEDHPEFDISLSQNFTGENDGNVLIPTSLDKVAAGTKTEEDELENLENLDDDESSLELDEVVRNYTLHMQPQQTIPLTLKFTPSDIETYLFDFPIQMSGVASRVKDLIRQVSGEGLQPRFMMDPSIVDFKKKFLMLGDKSFPDYKDIIISNPDIYPLTWRIDTSSIITKIFIVRPFEGKLESGASATLRISFNPDEAIEYYTELDVYLDDFPQPYTKLVVKGLGAIPRVTFDKREIIMPIVPLGITSKASFSIINEGYTNVELKYKINKDPGRIPLKLAFPEGQSLGTARGKIPVEISFTLNKAVSFTLILSFMDDEQNQFNINVSGTCENCLFTNFPFIQRNLEDITITHEPDQPIRLIYEDHSDVEDSVRWGGGKTAGGASSVISRSARSIIGYVPIANVLLEQGLEYITRWLNHQILSVTIHKFPDDVISSNGQQIYELVSILTGKQPPGMLKFNHGLVGKQLAMALHKQYSDLIFFLKQHGALLNTIRAEFLLSQYDYQRYLKATPDELQFKPKQITHMFAYLSMDSWTTLFYQIIKIFTLNRISPRTFKGLPGMQIEATQVESHMTESNVYSVAECILLKWLTYHFGRVHPHIARTIKNFDNDIKDGTVLAAAIQSHVGLLKSLSNLKLNPVNDEQRASNCQKVLEALNEIGVPAHYNANDLSKPSSREGVHIVMSLYNALPHYIPKTTIKFPCVLGQVETKTVSITNPGAKSLNYQVSIQGSKDFYVNEIDILTISPKATVNFPIHFQSRVTLKQTAKISFIHQSAEGGPPAAALVFSLESNVHSRVSLETFDISGPLYKLQQKELEIKNNFAQDGDFTITLVDTSKYLHQNAHKNKRGELVFQSPSAFFIRQEKIKIKKMQPVFLTIQFLPFEMETCTADIIFCDESVGEMQYSIIGKVELPEPYELPPVKGILGDPINVVMSIETRNKNLEAAKKRCIDRYASAQKAGERDSMLKLFRKMLEQEGNTFDIQIPSPYFQAPQSIQVNDSRKNKTGFGDSSIIASDASRVEQTPRTNTKVSNRGSRLQSQQTQESGQQQNLGTFTVTCLPREIAEYPCTIILTSSKRMDIRIYQFTLQVQPKKTKVTLEMLSQARKTSSQDIPIINNSDQNWHVKVNLIQQGREFTASRNFDVRRGQTGYCNVQFSPEWTCDIKANLTLEILQTHEVHEINLHGIGEEPNAEEHLTFDCKVKQTTVHSIPLTNPYNRQMTFRVESDLVGAIGNDNIILPPKGKGEYQLTLNPMASGSYTGAITFYDDQQRFIWYIVDMNVLEPEPEEERTLICQCRKALELKLTVYNPILEGTTFDVHIEGQGLLGDTLFYVPPEESGVYELLYSPLLPGETSGSINFVSEKTGEFWYKLKLVALPPDPVELDEFICEIGKSISSSIQLENPTGETVKITSHCSNAFNYEILPDKIIIPPYDSVQAQIRYAPSSVNNYETADIKLESQLLGDWLFRVRGRGTPPTEMDSSEVAAPVGETNSIQINFRNPFREQVKLNVELEGNDSFQLLVKRKSFVVGPLGILMLPVVYQPDYMQEHNAKLIIKVSDELVWNYPLKGITERSSKGLDYVFRVKCRNSLEKPIKIQLPDLSDLLEDEVFQHEVRVKDGSHAGTVDKSFALETIKNILNDPYEQLEYTVRFEPLVPFKTYAELLIYKSTGGRWRYNILLEAQPPDPDDRIILESSLNKTSSVCFRLNNQFKAYAEYHAYFSQETEPCFTVSPEAGTLEPLGMEGTPIIVSFTPAEYGAAKRGKLIIKTEDMMWSYLIIGRHPTYKVPEATSTKIDDHLSPNLMGSNIKRNHIRDNIIRVTSPSKSDIRSKLSEFP